MNCSFHATPQASRGEGDGLPLVCHQPTPPQHEADEPPSLRVAPMLLHTDDDDGDEGDDGGVEFQRTRMEDLPPELLCYVLDFLTADHLGVEAVRNAAAWCLTCSAFDAVCDIERRCRCRCLAASPVLFGLALSPLFGAPLTPAPSSAASVVQPIPIAPSVDKRLLDLSSLPSTPMSPVDSMHMDTDESIPLLSSSSSSPPSAQSRGGDTDNDGKDQQDAALLKEAQKLLTWRLRAQLMGHLPQRLVDKGSCHTTISEFVHKDSVNPAFDGVEVKVVDDETGRVHTNLTGQLDNLTTDHPFLNTNDDALASVLLEQTSEMEMEARPGEEETHLARSMIKTRLRAENTPHQDDQEFGDHEGRVGAGGGDGHDQTSAENARHLRALVHTLLFRGVDYFEMSVLRGTETTNRCVAIGMAQWMEQIDFIGWDNRTVGYHSDDGSIRCDNWGWREYHLTFSTGDVVGCGVDWETSELFFVHIQGGVQHPGDTATLLPKVITSKRESYELTKTPWFPAIGSTCIHDVVSINTGQEPFVFDIKGFIAAKRRSAAHSTART